MLACGRHSSSSVPPKRYYAGLKAGCAQGFQPCLREHGRALRAGRPTRPRRLAPTPCGPSLRSGKCLRHALAARRSSPGARRGSSLSERICPTAVGAGVLAPPQDLPRLGPLSAVGLVSPAAPPRCTAQPGGWAAAPAERPAHPYGCLRAGALRSPFARFSGSVGFASFIREG